MPDSTVYGGDLATRLASILDKGHHLSYDHREYCGMGLAMRKGHYCYAEVYDGRMPKPEEILKFNQPYDRVFANRDDFIAWLAEQSDASLSRSEDENPFYHNNQTLNRERLNEFVTKHESLPLVNLSRWKLLWQSIPAEDDGEGWFHCVFGNYQEEHRHYHNLKHLNECLSELDQVLSLSVQPAALETALWFHDSIYDPGPDTDNEGLSADLAVEALSGGNAPAEFIANVRALILLTKNHVPDQTPDAALMCDIDLSILGKDEERFLGYERDIRREYAWVPIADYLKGRRQVLERFLRRPRIYVTDVFADRYEAEARCNLKASLERLNTPGLL